MSFRSRQLVGCGEKLERFCKFASFLQQGLAVDCRGMAIDVTESCTCCIAQAAKLGRIGAMGETGRAGFFFRRQGREAIMGLIPRASQLRAGRDGAGAGGSGESPVADGVTDLTQSGTGACYRAGLGRTDRGSTE